jgi:Ni,Fe-hydrogenase I small subunit
MDVFDLRKRELTRRDFLKIAGATVAFLGLSQALTPKIVRALEANAGKPAVIWLEGQDCAGCVESFLNNLEPPAASLLLDTISLRYCETAMAASGYKSEEALSKTVAEGGYILVIEGSIPLAEDGLFCTVGGKPFKDIVRECAGKAAAIVCVGACASFGGIPRSGPTAIRMMSARSPSSTCPPVRCITSGWWPSSSTISPSAPCPSWTTLTVRWLSTVTTSMKIANAAPTSRPVNTSPIGGTRNSRAGAST